MAAHLKRRAPAAAHKRIRTRPRRRRQIRESRCRLHAGARLSARVALAMTLVAAALWTASDFLPALVWAVILAIAVWPLYARFVRTDQPSPIAVVRVHHAGRLRR